MKVNYTCTAIKSAALIPIFVLLPLKTAIATALFITLAYQYVIALIFGVKVMPTLDFACFLGSDKARVNIMSQTVYDGKIPFEVAKERYRKVGKKLPKSRSYIVEILNDYYYKEMPLEKSIDICFKRVPEGIVIKNNDDIHRFVEMHLIEPIPLNKPQWDVWWVDDYQGDSSLCIWRCHHSFADGISQIQVHVAQGDTYDPSVIMPIRKLSFLNKMILRLSFPLYIPKIIYDQLSIKVDKNALHDGKRVLSGKRKVAGSHNIQFHDVKSTSKKMGITINDLMTACLSATVKQYCIQKGDTKSDKMNIVIPANIRFKGVTKFEELKLENKFGPFVLTIPLINDIKDAVKVIPKYTAKIRTSFQEIYALYAFSYYLALFTPTFVLNAFVQKSTLPFTLAFSNTPGLLKPIVMAGVRSKSNCGYIISAGHCGLAFACISYIDCFSLSCVSDESVIADPSILVKLFETNFSKCYEEYKDMDISGSESQSPDKPFEKRKLK